MDEGLLDCEGAARFLLESCGVDRPRVDPFALAAAWGFTVAYGARSCTAGRVIFIRRDLSEERQRFDLAHELGHIIARHVGLDPSCERTASAIASAILCPPRALRRELNAVDWDLVPVRGLFDVSWEVIARRLVHVVGAIVSVWDDGRMTRRWRSPWLRSSGFSKRTAPVWEQTLAADCASSECHVEDRQGIRAYHIASPGWVRVVTVSEVEAWETLSASLDARQSPLHLG